MLVENIALLSQLDRRLNERLPRKFAELLMGQGHAADGAGDADGTMSERGIAFLEHGSRGGRRRGFAILDHRRLAFGGMNEHEPAAADVARGRMRDCQCERRGDRRIDGIAALLEDRQPRVGAWRRHGHDDAVAHLTGFLATVDRRRAEQCGEHSHRQDSGKDSGKSHRLSPSDRSIIIISSSFQRFRPPTANKKRAFGPLFSNTERRRCRRIMERERRHEIAAGPDDIVWCCQRRLFTHPQANRHG